MKKYICLLILLLAIVIQCFGLEESFYLEKYQQLDSVVQAARLYRINPLATEEERLQHLQALYATLPYYQSEDTLVPAIDQFLQAQFGSALLDYRIIPLADTPLSGNSHDPVFFVIDSQENLLLVVKAFQKAQEFKGRFLPEISSLNFIHMHKKDFQVLAPYPLSVGRTECQGTSYGLLAQSPAKGKRIDAIIAELQQSSPEEYDAHLAQLIQAFDRMIEATVRLNPSQEITAKIDSKLSEKMRKKMREIAEGPVASLIVDEISLSDLETYVEDVIGKTEGLEYIRGYSHNSAHFANVFFDSETSAIAYIDVAKMFDSYDINEEPLSFSAYDTARMVRSFRNLASSFMAFDEIERLANYFIEKYCLTSHDPNVHQLVTFLDLDFILGRLISHCDYNEAQDHEKRENHYKIFITAKKTLLKKLNDRIQNSEFRSQKFF